MKYGKFNADATEFIVTRPEPPRPWINYLTNDLYCAVISQSAGGYSFYQDCRTNRILRWAPENLYKDRPGRYLFIKEGTRSKGPGRRQHPRVWSATYQPLRVKPDAFQARHGLGYTTIRSVNAGLASEITYFVPTSEPCEIWLVTLANQTTRTRTLEVFPYVEWLLGDYHEEVRYRNIMHLYNRVWLDRPLQAIFAKKTAMWEHQNIQPFQGVAFFASSLPLRGYVTRKEAFVGRCTDETHPAMLFETPFRTVPLCSGEDGLGVLRHALTLQPGQTVTFTVVMGQAPTRDQVRSMIEKYRQIEEAQAELARVQSLWRTCILGHVTVETPDQEFNQIINVWVKYQLYICNLWSRSPSFYHEGSGGRGYRDSCQDSEGLLALNSEHAHQKMLKVAALIRRDGTCAPGWSDVKGPAGHRPNKDHPLWLTYTVASYIKETGDRDILNTSVPYLKDRWIRGWDVDPQWQGGAVQDGEGTLFEHLEANLHFTFHDVGPHGLPLIGHADWNDALDAVGQQGRGESVWIAMGLVRSLKTLAELADLLGETAKAQEWRRRASIMTQRINEVAWDGQWYLAGFTDDGTPFGSAKEAEGKMYLNTQSWAILAGVPDEHRQELLLKAVDAYLDREHGYALFCPAYSHFNPKLGRISMFSEGTKENAAIFCHAATFMIVADCIAGRGRQAYHAMRKLMPNAQREAQRYRAEPYVYAEYLIGPEHPYRSGEGAFTWLTGTASWTFMAAIEWLLGVRREYDGLRIDPCLPPQWRRCRVVRDFRGTVYDVTILNPQRVQRGVANITVDGQPFEGTLIPPYGDRRVHQVVVTMGQPSSVKPGAQRGRRHSRSTASQS